MKLRRNIHSPPTDDLIKFGRSKVKAKAGHRGGEGIHVYAGESKYMF